MQVLIFDRSKDIAKRIIDQISETNRDITFYNADSFPASINILKECSPDVVLLDLNFPGNTAIELLKEIKKANDKTVVIVWYTHADEQSLKLCRELGADFLFDKYDEFENKRFFTAIERTEKEIKSIL